MNESFTMKEILEQCDMSVDAVRYYEKIGLLPPVKRKQNGHRSYSPADKKILMAIKCFKKAGMTLEEIKHFLWLQNNEAHEMSEEMYRELRGYQNKIEEQQQQLQLMWEYIDAKLQMKVKFGVLALAEDNG